MAHQSTTGKAFVTRFSPEPEQVDTLPSEKQPPGVDDEPQSLEEALTGS